MTFLGSLSTGQYLGALGVLYVVGILLGCVTVAVMGERERRRRARVIARRPVAPLVPLDLARARRERSARNRTRGVA